MVSKDKDKQRRLKQAKYDKEKATIAYFRKMAPEIKPHLRQVGCDLPFYDCLDSYADEFGRTASAAMREFPTLLAIHEVEYDDFRATDWSKFSIGEYQQVFFDINERFADYGKNKCSQANIQGSATFFLDSAGSFKSVILIPRNPVCSFEHKDFKYAFKIGSLLHELGHVHDAEQRLNIEPNARRFDLVEAEVYANCFALDHLADRCLAQTYSMLFNAIETLASSSNYEAEIGRAILERHQRRLIPDWNDFMAAAKQRAAARH